MLGLTLEGGASRTVYSCGILDALLENDIMADKIFGVSAGAAFGVSYASKQHGRNFRLATEFMPTPEYMGIKHLLDPKNRCYYNLDYDYDTIPNKLLPFDYDTLGEYKGEFYAVCTNVETGRAEYLPVDEKDRKWMKLRASCALPMLFPEIEVEGKKYLDGGIADSIPYKKAIEMGCDKNIVILTRPRDYRKQTDSMTKLCMKRYASHPEFARAMATRAERYNRCVEEIMELSRQGKVFVFTPKTTFGVNRIEGDERKLRLLYEHGYKHANWAMDKLKAYLAR
ncbi:patatin family protein [Ruminococcus sp.]|uniref:patatin-like phospholipase family protein n=1 Tax=Ruminococcus sp. TaxID=41978 RepID=UPI0025F2789F|nr:patatin family protein [Ruminococcus sp.]MBQ8966982.1 patatin family protein [Ruminococcus sp.]